MKKFIPFLILVMLITIADVQAQNKKERLAFEKGDLMFYVMSGYPKIPDLSIVLLGDDMTDIPPIGAGFQISVINYLALGAEFIFTYTDERFAVEVVNYPYRRNFFIVIGKLFLHYPLRFFDPYIGGGAGYKWVRHDLTNVEDYAELHWTATAGFRIAFGNGAPFGLFVESSYPYPLIAGGIYFRFKIY